MKYLFGDKSCENCFYFNEEEPKFMMVHYAVDCLLLYDAKSLTTKQRKKAKKALMRYRKGESHPYCKFWLSGLLLTGDHTDIKKKGTEFLRDRLGKG